MAEAGGAWQDDPRRHAFAPNCPDGGGGCFYCGRPEGDHKKIPPPPKSAVENLRDELMLAQIERLL